MTEIAGQTESDLRAAEASERHRLEIAGAEDEARAFNVDRERQRRPYGFTSARVIPFPAGR